MGHDLIAWQLIQRISAAAYYGQCPIYPSFCGVLDLGSGDKNISI